MLLQAHRSGLLLDDRGDFRIEFGLPLIEPLRVLPQSVKKPPEALAQAVVRIFQPARQRPAQLAQLLGGNEPLLSGQATDLVALGLALAEQLCANAVNRLNILLLDAFTATKRMFGRLISSHTVSASFASFSLLFTYGLTNCRAISFTVKPCACS